ncbi:PREDICTED: WD-40 repeat-containing protein MSI1-like [Ipomoea nil]|uniref:WD-40 repeat-containing protein MSI1-like n=1 Tax=Ipomoea nil TaxID=35883 RepID=UPI000900A6D4|nr:PREDICTED: WD-40 repeat-containing protein MSI1-like [Ipomoea nil]
MSSGSRPTRSELLEAHEYWKCNIPILYDFIYGHNLKSPSLTVEWLPGVEIPEGELYRVQKLILGTRAAGNEQNRLLLFQVKLPNYDDEGEPRSSVGNGKLKRVQQINHDGVVNRARYMPQNPSIIATKTDSTEVFIFDCTKHPSNPPRKGVCNPDLRLTGHKGKGHALSWSPFQQGHLLSGSEDGQICLWDVNATPKDKTLEVMRIFDIDQHGSVEDVAWHTEDKNLFGSVGEDKRLRIWDIRTPFMGLNYGGAHNAKVNSLAFNPICGWVVATGSSDRKVILFDLRKFSADLNLHTLKWQAQEEVAHVRWNHKNANILASSCAGRKLVVWDLNRIGRFQTSEEAKGGPPEFAFLHFAHQDSITDFSWSPTYDMAIASAANDKSLHIWRMAKNM